MKITKDNITMTIYINGRSAVHQLSEGKLTTTSVNYTGKLHKPVAYKNSAYTHDAKNTAKSVFINGAAVCHHQSYLARSYGDEPGTHGGIYSGTVNGPAYFITHSVDVLIEGCFAVRDKESMVSNNYNTPPGMLRQPGTAENSNDSSIVKKSSTFQPGASIINWTIYGDVSQAHSSIVCVKV